MTIVVLLVLAVIWAAVLVPPFMRARSEARPADSIGNFRRQLSVLQRTGPVVVSPANTLRTSSPRTIPPYRAGASRLGPDGVRRARTLKRRRDVLYTLLAVMGGTFVLGMLPGLRVLLVFHIVADVLFVAYVALLVHMRNMAAERDMKLRFLPPPPAAEPALLLRRSAN